MATCTEQVGGSPAKGFPNLTHAELPRALRRSPMTPKSGITISPIDSRHNSPRRHDLFSDTPDDTQISRPTTLSPTKRTTRQLQPKLQSPTLSSQRTHRRAQTEHFRIGKSSLIPSDALEDIKLHTEEDPPKSKTEQGGSVFGIFQGESTPIRLGMLYSPATDSPPSSEASSPNQSQPSSPTKKMAMPSPLKNIAYSNPFSFFGTKSPRGSLSKTPEPADDEFLNLDIDATLFRSDTPNLSPEEALVTFQCNAQNLVRHMQGAYKLRTFALHQALAEKVDQKEELEEAQARLQNMKSQLNGMAARALEQDKELKALAEELKTERHKRQEEQERRRSVMVVNRPNEFGDTVGPHSRTGRQSKMSSGVSLSGDSGFESADESISESIFSKGTDDTAPTRPASVISTTIEVPYHPTISSQTAYQPSSARLQPVPPLSRQSTYDKVIKGISAAGSSLSNLTSSKCSNCHGIKVSDPGHVADILQEENHSLKSRITELEAAVEDCISLVGG